MRLTPELIADLRKIITYNWAAEQADYEHYGPEANDVFPALQRLRATVGEEGDTPTGIFLTRDQLNAWAGFPLTDEHVDRLDDALPHSSVPEAIATIADTFVIADDDDDDPDAAIRLEQFLYPTPDPVPSRPHTAYSFTVKEF